MITKDRQVWKKEKTSKHLPNKDMNSETCLWFPNFVRTRDRVVGRKMTFNRISMEEVDDDKFAVRCGYSTEFWKCCLQSSPFRIHLPEMTLEDLYELLNSYQKFGYDKHYILEHINRAKLYIHVCRMLSRPPDWDEFSSQNFARQMTGCPLPPPTGTFPRLICK